MYCNNNIVKHYTAFTTNWHSFKAVHPPLKVTFHCRKIPALSILLSWVDCVCWTRNYNVYDSTWRQRWLQWTGEVEAGSCAAAAVPVWLTFSCTLRLSITPLLLWLTHWTDSTLWFYGERMRTHCGAFFFFFTPLSSFVFHWIVFCGVWSYLLHTFLERGKGCYWILTRECKFSLCSCAVHLSVDVFSQNL